MDMDIGVTGGTAKDAAPSLVEPGVSRNSRSWKDFAELIKDAWRKGAKAFIETGRYLREAKEELDDFEPFLKFKLDFDASVGRKLMCIAGNSVLCAHVHKLPPCWSTLYELSKLPDDILLLAIADGRISPKMQRKDASALRKRQSEGTETREDNGESSVDNAANLVAAWDASSAEEQRQFLDHLGRAGLCGVISNQLLTDFRDHVLGLEITASSAKSTLAVNLTNLLHTALRLAEQPEPSELDKARAFATLIAMNRKLKATTRSLCDTLVAICKQQSKFNKKRN
jgi:hypothetical protein